MKILKQKSKSPIWLKNEPFRLENPFPGKHPVVYDIEVYPNYFLAVFIGQKNEPKIYTVDILEDMIYDLGKKKLYLIGFNNHGYDDIIIKYISMRNGKVSCEELYDMSKEIIFGDKNNRPQWYWDCWWYDVPWGFSMDVFCIPKKEVGLKERAARRHWAKIQDLPIHPDQELSDSEKKIIIPYCENDVRITIEEWNDVQGMVEVRKKMAAMFPGADVRSKHDAAICEEIIIHEYGRLTGASKKILNSMKDKPGKRVEIKDCIPSWIEFRSPVLQNLIEDWSAKTGRFSTDSDKNSLSRVFDFENLSLTVGTGGIHSNDTPLVVESGKKLLIDIDVASYYPNLIKSLHLRPEHMTADFNYILENMTDKRLAAKKEGRKTEADGLKIVVNSAFGKTGNKWSVMFDERMQLQVTLGGQLTLLMLMEMLRNKKIEILSMNTDGILCSIGKLQYPILRKVCKAWEELTGLTLEETPYQKYIRRDVNNYLALKENGQTKEKGVFKRHIRGKASIISKAIRKYYINGVEIGETILNERDLRSFIFYTHVSMDSKLFHKKYEKMEPVQNTCRWYVSLGVDSRAGKYEPLQNVGNIIKCLPMTEKEKVRWTEKHKSNNHPDNWMKFISAPWGTNAVLINDLPSEFPEDLNRHYYIDQCLEIIKSIENEKSA